MFWTWVITLYYAKKNSKTPAYVYTTIYHHCDKMSNIGTKIKVVYRELQTYQKGFANSQHRIAKGEGVGYTGALHEGGVKFGKQNLCLYEWQNP